MGSINIDRKRRKHHQRDEEYQRKSIIVKVSSPLHKTFFFLIFQINNFKSDLLSASVASESDGWMFGSFTQVHFDMVEYFPLLNVGEILSVDAAQLIGILYEFHFFYLPLTFDRDRKILDILLLVSLFFFKLLN